MLSISRNYQSGNPSICHAGLTNDVICLLTYIMANGKWQMLLHFEKCICLHTEHGNTGVNYEMGGIILCKTVKEKCLGVTITANMKISEQCRIAAARGNQIIGIIRSNITYKEKRLIV